MSNGKVEFKTNNEMIELINRYNFLGCRTDKDGDCKREPEMNRNEHKGIEGFRKTSLKFQ